MFSQVKPLKKNGLVYHGLVNHVDMVKEDWLFMENNFDSMIYKLKYFIRKIYDPKKSFIILLC